LTGRITVLPQGVQKVLGIYRIQLSSNDRTQCVYLKMGVVLKLVFKVLDERPWQWQRFKNTFT